MGVRRKTTNRLTLYRTCHACGRIFRTTADHPFIRQLPSDGKKQKTCYFCTEECWRSSYKHSGWWDGQAEARRAERDAARAQEKNRRYYAAHREKERQRARARYWSDPAAARADQAYQRRKRAIGSECGIQAAVLDL